MIRIIYTWKVSSENIELFKTAWSKTTQMIHETVSGARGSFMLHNVEAEEIVLTIARWDSYDHWKAFWKADNPEQMLQMRELGERISVEVYDEVDDFTK